jgi:cytochrome c biogenesis protein CcdA
VGALLSLAGLLLCLLLDPRFQYLLYFGLVLVVFSKEKTESEIVSSVRAEVFKSVFGFTLSFSIALHLTEQITKGFSADLPAAYEIGFPLLLYLVLFYGSLIFRVEVDSSMDFVGNMRNHRRLLIPLALLVMVITVVLVLRYMGVI